MNGGYNFPRSLDLRHGAYHDYEYILLPKWLSVHVMKLQFPRFQNESLNKFSACAIFIAMPPARLDGLDQKVRLQSRYEDSTGIIWVRLAIDRRDDRSHVHLDFGRDDVYEMIDGMKLATFEEIGNQLDRFSGQDAALELSANYTVGFGSLPPYGAIATLCDVETESCGAMMSMRGATMSIESDFHHTLRWELDRDDGTVCTELLASTRTEINEGYLVSLIDLMRDGFNCFVLEGYEPPDDGHNDARDDAGEMRKVADS